VLYAKFGLYEKAEREFKGLLAKAETRPGLVNLANLRLLKARGSDALELFQRAERYAYLAQGSGDGNRASSAGTAEDMLWSAEEGD
jgi:hypothetical protein